MAAGNIAGPAIAGVLVVSAGPGWALLIDAACYGAGAALIAVVRSADDARLEGTEHFLADLRDGFAEVPSRTWVWSTMVAFAVLTTFAPAFPVLGALTAKRHFGGAGAWAAILVARAVGSLIGGTMVFNALWETTLQHHIPPSARSRVSAYDWLGSIALQPVGYALIGPLAAGVGVSAALYLCGAAGRAVGVSQSAREGRGVGAWGRLDLRRTGRGAGDRPRGPGNGRSTPPRGPPQP
jgi:hypothetical protein